MCLTKLDLIHDAWKVIKTSSINDTRLGMLVVKIMKWATFSYKRASFTFQKFFTIWLIWK